MARVYPWPALDPLAPAPAVGNCKEPPKASACLPHPSPLVWGERLRPAPLQGTTTPAPHQEGLCSTPGCKPPPWATSWLHHLGSQVPAAASVRASLKRGGDSPEDDTGHPSSCPPPQHLHESSGKHRGSAAGIPEPRAACAEFEMLHNLLSERQAPGEEGHALGLLEALESALLSSLPPRGGTCPYFTEEEN